MKKYISIFLLLGAVASVKAQQLQTSSLAEMQGFIHNPAMAGVGQKLMVGAT